MRGQGFRDSEYVQDQVGVDGDGASSDNGHDRAEDDEEAEDLVVRVQHEREEEAKDQGELEEWCEEHDRCDGKSRVEKAMGCCDEDPRVNEPAGVLAG